MSPTILQPALTSLPDVPAVPNQREAVLQVVLDSDRLITPPVIALQIVNAVSQPDCEPSEIVSLLHQDPALCAQLLKAVNSCLYALRQPVTSIQRAVTILGLHSVRSLALALSLPAVRNRQLPREELQDFWIGSVAGAILARELAIRQRRPSPDDDFVAGLLRDLGELLLRQAFPDRWREHQERQRARLLAEPCAAERDSFGIDHAEISAELLHRWHIPPEIVEPIRYHHEPDRLTAGTPSLQARAELLRFAALLTRLDEVTQDPLLLNGVLSTAQVRYNLPLPDLIAFLEQVVPKVDEFARLVNQDIGQCPDYAAVLAAGSAELVSLSVANQRSRLSQAGEVVTTVRLSAVRGPGSVAQSQSVVAAPVPTKAAEALPQFRSAFLSHFPKTGCLLGDYELRRLIGSGAMGLVFQAFEPRLGRDVAVKLLAPQLAAVPVARQRFAREARMAAAIQHENVVAIYAIGEADGIPFLTMEYVRGSCLENQIEQFGPFPLKALVTTGRQIAAGLAAAHAKDIIHRDIKPGNILIEADTGRVKLTDFGLARVGSDSKLSVEGQVAGTPLYMAPSVIHGKPADQLADLFSLGGVLYTLATGHPPFPGQTMAAVFRAVCESEPIPPRQVRPEVPLWLNDLILALLHKDPARRFPSARQAVAVFDEHSRD